MDKFYTNPDISKKYIDIVGIYFNWSDWDLVIEPSAGLLEKDLYF
jgi:hypothetical protein